ncbi:hypothetical protein ACTUVN_004782 [Pseudomonas caspiana]
MQTLTARKCDDDLILATEKAGIDFHATEWEIWRWKKQSDADKPIIFRWSQLQLGLYLPAGDDHGFALLLKRVAVCLLFGIGGRRYAPSTVHNMIVWYKNFFLSLQSQGHFRMSLITSAQVRNCFDKYLSNFNTGKPNTLATIEQRLSHLYKIHQLKLYIGDGFEKDPFPKKFRNQVISKMKSGKVWEAPPEPVCFYLLNKSIEIIRCLSSDIIRIFTKYTEAANAAVRSGISERKRISHIANQSIATEYFDTESTLGNLIEGLDARRAIDVAYLMNRLVTACFIVITYTCGTRVSELRRATTSSVQKIQHSNGSEYYYYHAARSKKRYSTFGNDGEFLEGADIPWIMSPAAVTAMEVLYKLSAPARARSGSDNLWLTTNGNSLWSFKANRKCSVLSSTQFNIRLNNFSQFINLSEATGWKGRLHSHMGRKHLARFIAKRDRTGLGDLALQYSHVSAYSVDLSYARPDSEFHRMVKEELMVEMEAVARELTECDVNSVYTNNTSSEEPRVVAKFLGRIHTDREIKILLSRGTILIPCQWGVCMYRQETSACEGSRAEPNPANRNPSTCKGCVNFLAYAKHRRWWEDYRDDSVRLLRQSNLPKQVRLVLEQRMLEAEQILAKI